MAESTIGVSEETKKELDALKQHPRETYEDVIKATIKRPQCIEMVFKPVKGNPHNEQCKRRATEGSLYCKLHQGSNKGKLLSGKWECGCTMKDNLLEPCQKHRQAMT